MWERPERATDFKKYSYTAHVSPEGGCWWCEGVQVPTATTVQAELKWINTRRGSAFLRKLRSFSFSSRMMESFYQSAVAGAVYLAAVCWENSSRAGNTNRMNKLIRKSSSVTGCKLDFQWQRGMCVCSVVLASLLDRITRMFSTTKRRSSFYTSQQPSWTGIAVNT